jgi:septal ring factor EnvC (AmiA/AmiB activator)
MFSIAQMFLLTFALAATPNGTLIRDWKSLDASIHKISAKEAELINQKLNLELAISENTENIKGLAKLIDDKRSLIIGRIRYLNQESGSDLLRNLMESSNPGQLERNHHFFSIATRLDIDLVRQHNRDILKLDSERQKYAARISKLNNLQRELKSQAEKFLGDLKIKADILNKIRRRMKSNAQEWAEELKVALVDKNKGKINLYQSLLNKNFLDRKGHLTSPSDANIKLHFGAVKLDPAAPAVPFQGVLFESTLGSPVRAMADGTVTWIGLIEGLGNTIILDHGRDLHSIYSRVQLANLNIGDMIEEGKTMGRVTLGQGRIGAGLYFEVREGRMPTDPLRWILTKSGLFTRDTNQWENVQ